VIDRYVYDYVIKIFVCAKTFRAPLENDIMYWFITMSEKESQLWCP